MIVAVASVLDEAGIIEQTVTHLLGQGVDHIIVSDGGSVDGTREILTSITNVTLVDQINPFHQANEMTKLARLAGRLGADWVVPFDADEFWCGVAGLADLSETIGTVYATMWQYVDMQRRHLIPKPLPKVAFRPNQGCRLAWGQHSVEGVPGGAASGLTVCELQYRDFDHFVAKVEKARRLHASWDIPAQYGSHMTVLFDADLQATWKAMQDIPTLLDPIDYRGVEWT